MKKRWIFIPIIGVLIIGVILGSFLDLQINKGIFDAKNGFGLFMAAFGETPAYALLGTVAAGFVYLGIKHYKLPWQRIVLFTIAFLGVGFCTYFQGKHIFDKNAYYTTDKVVKLLGYGIGFLIAMLGMLAGYFLFKNNTCSPKQLLLILIVIYAIMAAANGFNQLAKIIMCRPRYRVVSAFPNDMYYCNWWESGRDYKDYLTKYHPDIYSSEDFKSFPSGHMTNMATLIYVVPMLKRINSHIKLKEGYLMGIAIVWTIVLAYTRMRVGAHFLSDVSMGTLVAILFSYIGNEFYLHFEKKIEVQPVTNE